MNRKKFVLRNMQFYLIILILSATEIFSLGCCEPICKTTPEDLCYGNYYENVRCDELDECNIGCCIDKDGYCLSNYLKGNCIGENGTFITRECPDVYYCTKEIVQPDVRGYTGFETIFNSPTVTDGFSIIEPESGLYGSLFNIGYYFYDKEEIAEIKARVKDNTGVIQTFSLYDNGAHGDRNPQDSFYAEYFDSFRVPVFDNYKKLDIDFVITLKNNTIVERNNFETFTIANTKCLPVDEFKDPTSKYNVVFISNNYNYLSDFENDVNDHVEHMKNIRPFSEVESLSFYMIPNQNQLTEQQAIDKVNAECYFFDPTRDMIIMLDKNRKYCSNFEAFASTDPIVMYAENALHSEQRPDFNDITDSLHNICYFITTSQELDDYTIEIAIPPEVEILTPNGTEFDTSDPTIAFKVRDNMDQEISYTILALGEETYTIYGMAVNDAVTEDNFIGLVDGDYDVWIEVEDSNGNSYGSSDIIIFVRSDLVALPSPPIADFEDILLSILLMVLTVLIAIVIIFYHKE